MRIEHRLPTHVGIIGAGRLGRVLAHASRRAGLHVIGAWSPTLASRERFAAEIGTPVTGSVDAVVTGADVVFVAVPDERLADVLSQLASIVDPARRPLVVITSGSSPIELGAPSTAAGARVVRIHPLQAVPDTAPPDSLDGILAAVTASTEQDAAAARALATRLGMRPFDLDDSHAPIWHAAGAIAAGGITTLLAAARDLAVDAGVTPDLALDAMAALAATAVERARTSTPERSLTGPVVRGDAATVEAHLAALRTTRPDLVDTYRELNRATVTLARSGNRIHERDAARLHHAIDEAVTTWA